MLPIEFSLVLISSIITSVGVGLLVIRLFYSPVFESRIFLVGATSFGLYFYSVLPATLLNSVGEPIDLMSTQLFKLSTVFAHIGLFFLILSILLPTISNSYKNLFLLIFLTILATTASIINYQTISFTVSESGFLVVSYEYLLSLFLMVGNGLAYVFVLLFRIRSVSNILRETETKIENHHILSLKFFLTHSVLVTIAIGTLAFTRFFSIGILPGFIWYIPLSVIVLYLSYAVFKDECFLFITPAKFDALLISDKKSGLSLLTKNFHSDSNAEQLLGNLLSAVNISLKANLQSKGNLEQVVYGDKVVVTYSGEYITSFLIVTQANFITSSIAKFITKQYEKKFKEYLILNRSNIPVKASIFKDFNSEVEFVRRYIPL